MSDKNIVISKKLHKQLLEDKARVDYLEKVAERGWITLLGLKLGLPKPEASIRNTLDSYRFNDKKF
jgi:hypothetical protein